MIQNRYIRCASLLACVLVVQGCAAPGVNINMQRAQNAATVNEGPQINVMPITSDLIANERGENSTSQLLDQLNQLEGEKPGEYTVGPGDRISVTVWRHPELSTPSAGSASIPPPMSAIIASGSGGGGGATSALSNPSASAGPDAAAQGQGLGHLVEVDGTFFFPYLGKVPAAGMTLDQLRNYLNSRLKKFVRVDDPAMPLVDVSVSDYKSQKVYFSGAFERATSLTLSSVPLSIADALGQAGINLEHADLSGLVLYRGGKRYPLNLDALSQAGRNLGQVFLRDKDQLEVPYNDRKKVYVLGEVMLSRAVPLRLGSVSLADALSSAGGPRQETSSGASIYVLRDTTPAHASRQTVDVYQLNANAPDELVLADKFQLQSGDVVYVASMAIARWNRIVSLLVPSSSLFTATQSIQAIGNNVR